MVQRRLTEALDALDAPDALGTTPRHILSLCAGEGRDVVPVLATRHARAGLRAVLVERDPQLAGRAADAAHAAGLASVDVRCADAGLVASFVDVLPVDVLLVCGVFGNLAHDHVRAVVGMLPRLVAPGGFVLWTRGGSAPDRRQEVRRWFSEARMEEHAFDGAPALYGVGLHRRPAGPVAAGPVQAGGLSGRLFTFEEEGAASGASRWPRDHGPAWS